MFCGDETCWAEEGKGLIVMGQHSKFGNDMHSEDSLSPFRNGRSLHYDRVRHCCHRYPRWCTWNHPLPCSERRCRRWREFQADRCRKWTRSLRDARATSEPLQITTTLICRKALDQGPGLAQTTSLSRIMFPEAKSRLFPDAVERLRRESPKLPRPVDPAPPPEENDAAARPAEEDADPAPGTVVPAVAVAAAGCSCCDTHWLNGMPNTAPDSPRRCDASATAEEGIDRVAEID